MNINVKNISQSEALIEIEGVIGVPEQSQYADNKDDMRISTYEKFRRAMAVVTDRKVEKLRINIRSTGGSVEDALLIHAALCELSGVEIETHCYGFVASAATIIAQAACAGCRYVAGTAMYLIHNSSTVVEGNASDAKATADMLSKTDERIAQIYAQRSGMEVEHFARLMARDSGRGEWLSPQEVVEYGLADRVESVSPIKNFVGRVRDFLRFVLDGHAEQNIENICNDLVRQDSDEMIRSTMIQAQPTATLPKEDPAVEHSVVNLTGNRKSYIRDAEVFRE